MWINNVYFVKIFFCVNVNNVFLLDVVLYFLCIYIEEYMDNIWLYYENIFYIYWLIGLVFLYFFCCWIV